MSDINQQEQQELDELISFIVLYVPEDKRHALAKIMNRYVRTRVHRTVKQQLQHAKVTYTS
jgi:hypothetical protein